MSNLIVYGAKIRLASRRPAMVVAEQAAESFPAGHMTLTRLVERLNQLIPEALVISLKVIMLGILRDGSPEVPLITASVSASSGGLSFGTLHGPLIPPIPANHAPGEAL